MPAPSGPGPAQPPPVNAPASSSHISASPEPLCSPNARSAPVPLAARAQVGRAVVAVEHVRVAGAAAVRPDQGVRRQRLAAVGGHLHLALGDQRGGEVEHHRPARQRHPDGHRGGGEPALDRAERGDQRRAGHVHEVDGDQAGGQRPSRRSGRPARCARRCAAPPRSCRGRRPARCPGPRPALATVWPKPRLPSSTANAPPSVTTVARCPARMQTGAQPVEVARHPHHAVAVVPGQVGLDQLGRRSGPPRRRRSRRRRRCRAPAISGQPASAGVRGAPRGSSCRRGPRPAPAAV